MAYKRVCNRLSFFVCLAVGSACGTLQVEVGFEPPPTGARSSIDLARATAKADLQTQIVATATALRLTALAGPADPAEAVAPPAPTATSIPSAIEPPTIGPQPVNAPATRAPQPIAASTFTAVLPTLAASAIASPAPSITPAATATPAVIAFDARRRTEPGRDGVELTWQAVGDQISICPLLDTYELSAGCFYDLPASGTRFVQLSEIVANYTGFRLVANTPSGVAYRDAAVSVICPTFDTWFFANRPPVCPQDPPFASNAAVQRFERGRMVWLEALDRFYILFDGQPGRLTLIPGPLELKPGASPDNRSGETPPAGLYEPISGFGLIWRGEVIALNGMREALGWAVAPESGFQTLHQCEIVVGPTLSCYLRSPEGQTLNFYYMRYFGHFWTVR